MNKSRTRITALLLTLALLLAALSCCMLPVAAETQGGEATRFIFSALSDVAPANDTLTLSLAGGGVFEAQGIHVLRGISPTNSLYICLTNRSNATRIRVTYTYASPSPQIGSVEQILVPYSDEQQAFVLRAPQIENATALTVMFLTDGELDGSVTLHSFYNLESMNLSGEQEITLDVCRYNREHNTIELSGSVSYAATVKYAGGMLALFALEPDDESISNKTTIARTGLSFTFSFSIAVESAADLFARYVVAAIAPNGERVPLCTPYYPAIPGNLVPKELGFKGFQTDDTLEVLESGADFEILDVYLDRLQLPDNQSSDIYYAGDFGFDYLYFDEAYVAELDRRVRNLSGAGCSVFLRFLISPTADWLSYTEFGSPEGTENKAIVLTGEQALLEIYALTDFLTSRYRGGNYGAIDGIVLGKGADRSLRANYAGTMGLTRYAENYASVLALIAGTAQRNIPTARMIVPISDRMQPQEITAADLNGDFCAELFLNALLLALRDRCFAPPQFTLLVESNATPNRLGPESGECFGVDRLDQLLLTVRACAARNAFLNAQLLYSWTPDEGLSADQMRAAYVLQYVTLYRNEQLLGFAVDCSEKSLSVLRHLVGQIDTTANAQAIAPVLDTLGVDSLQTIFPGFTLSDLQTRVIRHFALSVDGYGAQHVPPGRYTLFDFATATDTLQWYGGERCLGLSLLSGPSGKALTAKLSAQENHVADVAYSFSRATDLSFASLWRFRAGIDGATGTAYELRLTLIGEHDTVYASGILTSGSVCDLFLDLTTCADALGALRSVRLSARPLNGQAADYTISLHSLTVESLTLTDAELAERILAGLDTESPAPEEHKDYKIPIILTVILVLASVALAAMLLIRHRSKKIEK